MQRVTSIIGGRRLRYNHLFTGVICRRSRLSCSTAHRRAIISLESHRHHSHITHCNTATPTIIQSFSSIHTATNSNHHSPTTRRLFWSSTDEIAEAVEQDTTTTSISLLPISPITPSNISATSLLSSTTLDSLNSLPECKFVLDLLNGTDDNDVTNDSNSESGSSINITKVKEAHQNLSRANDILSSMPDLQISIKLLEIDLLCICGKFNEALNKLNQYEIYLTKQQQSNQVEAGGVGEKGEYDTKQYHHGHSERDIHKRQYNTVEEANETIQRMRLKGKDPSNSLIPYYNPQLGKYLIGNDINSGTSNTMQSNTLLQIQVIKSKLLCNIGQYEYALSEYENMLENMEREVERQMNHALALQQQQQQEINNDDARSDEEKEMEMPTDTLPVIHGASALTGVGVTKLLLHLREHTTSSSSSTSTTNNNTSEIEDIIESIQTATEILLESRTDAIKSPTHTTLAVDLGIAASISLTNLGITHALLNNNTNTAKTKKRAMKYWKKGIQTLDLILENAVTSTIIIPRHKFQLMESVRARLYCNIAYVLLGLDNNVQDGKDEDGNKKLDQILDDKTLKEASDAAKKALDIYDELLNGSKMTRGAADIDEVSSDNDEDTNKDDTKEDTTTSEEWEKILKDQASLPDEEEHDPNKKSKDIPISHLWKSYHKAESARALGLVAQCYAMAGAAVTAEGLFQSALDASSSYPIGQSLSPKDTNGRGVSLSSPNLGLIARDVRLWYATLCNNWDKRKGDADRLREEAMMIEDEGVLKDYVRLDGVGEKRSISGLESSLWIFSPGDFER